MTEHEPPFVIFALPRSRTRWLASYLTYADWQCGHDEIRHCRSLDDVKSWLGQAYTGTIETAGAPFWRLLLNYRPDVRVITIRRPVLDVVTSMERTGVDVDPVALRTMMTRLDHKLDQIEHRVPGTRSFAFNALVDQDTCADLFTHCLPYPFDHAWWDVHDQDNIQINLKHLLRYFMAHRPQLEKLAKQAKHRMLSALPHNANIEGVTFQEETMAAFDEAIPLFREHLVLTDQAPDAYLNKNVPLLRKLEEIGALQIMSARSNGRLFGYLVTVVAPSLDALDTLQGWHTLFFASPQIKNLHTHLHRAAIGALKARGVAEVHMRTSPHGTGHRLGTIYRRLGAEEFAQLYRLSLED